MSLNDCVRLHTAEDGSTIEELFAAGGRLPGMIRRTTQPRRGERTAA